MSDFSENGPFPPGSLEASTWRAMYGPGSPGAHLIGPDPTPEEEVRLRALVAKWEQERRDREWVEIITRLG